MSRLDLTLEVLRPGAPFAWVEVRGERHPVYPDERFVATLNNIVERMGGQTGDLIAVAQQVANVALATAQGVGAGIDIPAASSTVALDPPSPISAVTPLSASMSRVTILMHTRTGAAAPISAGFVDVARGDENSGGIRYFIFYDDPGNAGGDVVFQASAKAEDAAPYRVVGAVHVPAHIRRLSGVVVDYR